MVKAEKAFKWGIAIIVIFGILNAFYFLNLTIALKIVLPVLCVFMIGSILLQSGKGGGLAAIGGLGDQSAFGTRTSTFLTKITYLIGAAFIVATVFLFKLSVPTKTIHTMVPQEEQHTHGDVSQPEAKTGNVSDTGKQNVSEGQPGGKMQESSGHQTGMKGGASQSQSAGMNPVKEGDQTSDVTEKSVAEEQKETRKNSNK